MQMMNIWHGCSVDEFREGWSQKVGEFGEHVRDLGFGHKICAKVHAESVQRSN